MVTASACAAVTGCTGEANTPQAAVTPTGSGALTSPDQLGVSTDPDVILLTRAIRDEVALLAACLRVSREQHDLVDLVRPITAAQLAHVHHLRVSLSHHLDLRPPRRIRVPSSKRGALVFLRHQVSAAEQSRLADCLHATSGLLARLLASVSASHAMTLEGLLEGLRSRS